MESVGLVSETFQVFDGTDVMANCTQLNKLQWTNNVGAFLCGSAVVYNLTMLLIGDALVLRDS